MGYDLIENEAFPPLQNYNHLSPSSLLDWLKKVQDPK